MNDRYLFIGKCTPQFQNCDNNRWEQGNLFVDKDGATHIVLGCGVSVEVDPATVGQCVGLKDKNGVLIFEGYIVDIPDTSPHGLYVVAFDNDRCAEFVIDWNGDSENHRGRMIKDVEEGVIIGNVHDNLELLEASE